MLRSRENAGVRSDAGGDDASRARGGSVGVAPKMRALARDAPEARLALSLHAPTQALRETIVPSSTAYPLDAIMAALDEYLEGPPPRRRAS